MPKLEREILQYLRHLLEQKPNTHEMQALAQELDEIILNGPAGRYTKRAKKVAAQAHTLYVVVRKALGETK